MEHAALLMTRFSSEPGRLRPAHRWPSAISCVPYVQWMIQGVPVYSFEDGIKKLATATATFPRAFRLKPGPIFSFIFDGFRSRHSDTCNREK